MNFKADYIVGKQSNNEWSTVYGYKPEDSDDIELFSIMRMSTDVEDISLDKIGKMLLDELQVSFFDGESDERDLIIRLENAAWKMKSKMDLILSREAEIAQKGIDIELAVGIIFEDYLYIGVIGESKVYISRNDEIVEISRELVDANMSGFIRTGSLNLEGEDKLLLTTSRSAEIATQHIMDALDLLNIRAFLPVESNAGIASILIASDKLTWNVPLKEEANTVEEETQEDDLEEASVTPLVEDLPEEAVAAVDEEEIDNVIDTSAPDAEADMEYEEVVGVPLSERIAILRSRVGNTVLTLREKIKERRSKTYEEEVIDEDEDNAVEVEKDQEVEEYSKTKEMRNKLSGALKTGRKGATTLWQNKVKPQFSGNQKTYMNFLKVVASKIADLLKKIMGFAKQELVGTGDRKDIYLRGKRRDRNRKIFVVLLVILIAVLYIGLRNAEENRREQEKVNTAKTQVESIKSRYQSLANQVSQTKSENEEKKNLLITEFTKLEEDINNQKKSGLFIDDLNKVAADIQVKEDDLLFIESFTQPSIITDVGKTFPDATLTDLLYTNGSVFISDSSRNVVYKTPVATLDNNPEAYVTGLVQPYLLVKDAAGDIVFYDNDTSAALGKFGPTQANLARFSSLSIASIGKPAESVIYEGNNALYELRTMNKQIFKRDKAGDTYIGGGAAPSSDSTTNWRTDNDYTNGLDIAAPYEIYVLIKNQGIKRYFAKNDNTLTFASYNNFLQKDFDSLAQASSIDVTLRFMAVADPVNKRVMVFQVEDNEEKRVTFLKQFVYRGTENIFNDLDEVVINEQDRIIYALDGTKVIKLQF